jgi:SAM-dependent methyltransferase
MSIPTKWTREQVVAFLEEERPKYQRIELPYGLSTPGQDRTSTAKLVLPDRLDGKSVLDIGSFLGFFCHEAHRRGATRIVGFEMNAEHVRHSRKIADCLGMPIDFQRKDLDYDPPPGRFDVVLCLNVLHHLRNPVAALETLLACAKDRLVVEIAGVEHEKALQALDADGALRWIVRKFLADKPVVVIASGQQRPNNAPVFFASEAIRKLLLGQSSSVARVDVLPSPFKERFLAIAWKRRIDDLAFLAGVPSSGKSTLMARMGRGELPEMRAALGMDRAAAWTVTTPFTLRTHTEPHMAAMAYHYDLMRGSPEKFGSFFRDLSLEVLGVAERTRGVLLWTDPAVLLERLRARTGEDVSPRRVKAREERVALFQDRRWVATLMGDWFEFCRAKGLSLTYVDNTTEPKVLSPREYFDRLRAAGWADEIGPEALAAAGG